MAETTSIKKPTLKALTNLIHPMNPIHLSPLKPEATTTMHSKLLEVLLKNLGLW